MWQKKQPINQEKGDRSVDEKERCRPGFHCMFLIYDVVVRDPKALVKDADEEKFYIADTFNTVNHNGKEASKLPHLINANRKETELGESSDLLVHTMNGIETENNEDDKTLPDHMLKFFMPAERIMPQHGSRILHHFIENPDI